MVGCDLEQFRRVLQPMDFIQYDPLATEAFQEALRVEQHPADAGQFTVEILDARKVLTQAGFPYSTDPGQPNYGSLSPCSFQQFRPKMSMYHSKAYLHIVAPNASAFAEASCDCSRSTQLCQLALACSNISSSEIGSEDNFRAAGPSMLVPSGVGPKMTILRWFQETMLREDGRGTCQMLSKWANQKPNLDKSDAVIQIFDQP